MNKKQLAIILSKLHQFAQPQAKLEQYATESELGAELLWIAYMQGDIQDKDVADLGCGPGIFGIGALLLGAKNVFFVDIDPEAIEMAKKNIAELDKSLQKKATIMLSNIVSFQEKVNTVIQNPPFGVQEKGADTAFLEKAFAVGDVVYSIHKENTSEHIRKVAERNNFNATEIRNVKFPLPRTMHHHAKERAFVAVTLWRFKKR